MMTSTPTEPPELQQRGLREAFKGRLGYLQASPAFCGAGHPYTPPTRRARTALMAPYSWLSFSRPGCSSRVGLDAFQHQSFSTVVSEREPRRCNFSPTPQLPPQATAHVQLPPPPAAGVRVLGPARAGARAHGLSACLPAPSSRATAHLSGSRPWPQSPASWPTACSAQSAPCSLSWVSGSAGCSDPGRSPPSAAAAARRLPPLRRRAPGKPAAGAADLEQFRPAPQNAKARGAPERAGSPPSWDSRWAIRGGRKPNSRGTVCSRAPGSPQPPSAAAAWAAGSPERLPSFLPLSWLSRH